MTQEKIGRLSTIINLRSNHPHACASLWIDGEHVLHDATRDSRTPTHELTIARDVLFSWLHAMHKRLIASEFRFAYCRQADWCTFWKRDSGRIQRESRF
jgi:hypothetical protein